MPRPSRLLAALLVAALFLLAGAERAFSYAACPHHGIPADTGTGHQTHTAHEEGPPEHSGPCTCLGACQAAGIGFAPAPAAPRLPAAGITTRAAAVAIHSESLPGLAPHTLPFTTAPPATPQDR